MLLEHRFVVPLPPDDAWAMLLDVERVAPCLPGVTLESVEGAAFAGKLKIKLGSITVTYRGAGTFTQRDATARRAVVEAVAREVRGSGSATARVTATLEPSGEDETTVLVYTDVAITGRAAHVDRDVLTAVGAKLIDGFADCLAAEIIFSPAELAADHGDLAAPASVAAPAHDGLPTREAAPSPPYRLVERAQIDPLDVAGASLGKRVLPPVAGLAALAIGLTWWWRRR
ncbi:MAG: SRPBCC family protein [Actinomycetes bacterium]